MIKIKQDFKDKVINYKDQIETRTDYKIVVRGTPTQYIGLRQNPGYLNMIREIFQNSMDEIIKGNTLINRINVVFNESTYEFSSEDFGRGIPFGEIIRIFSEPNTSSNYTKKEGEFSSGRHGVGAKVVNTLSKQFIAESYICKEVLESNEGQARRVEFYDFEPLNEQEFYIPNEGNKQGSIISFIPRMFEDNGDEVMGNITVTVNDVLQYLKALIPLSIIGTTVHFTGVYKNGKIYEEEIINKDGIMTYLIMQTTSPLIKPIFINKYTGKMKCEILFTYDSQDFQSEQIVTFSNYCPTREGTHLEGFLEGISKFFRDYMNKIYLANNNKNKLTIINSDVRTGLKAAVTVSHLTPDFTGQAKERLSNPDMFDFVKNAVLESLEQWSKENSSDMQKICKQLKSIAEIRVKSEEGKVKLSNKYNSALTGLPDKYDEPTGTEDLECIIVEGDSAGGSAKNKRCKRRQGIFPIRGKIPNAFLTEPKKFFSNEEVNGLLTIYRQQQVASGRKVDLSKCPIKRIIFLPDADADGGHIRGLLLKMHLRYLLEFILAGMVYAAMPPLYGIKKGKKVSKYFIDNADFVSYIQNIFSRDNVVQTIGGRRLSKNELVDIFLLNMDYIYELGRIMDTFALDPYLLEMILINKDKSFDQILEMAKQRYRFVINVENRGTLNKFEVEEGNKIHSVFINDKFYNKLNPLYDKYINNSNNVLDFIINGERTSLYGLMELFDKSSPAGLKRYKGLGEMNADELAESTLHPDSNRTLLQYTLESAQAEISRIDYLESNKNEYLQDIKVSRMDLIG